MYSDDEYYGYTSGYAYRGGYSDEDRYYDDGSDDSSTIETKGLLITHPKTADADQGDHHESGSYLFNGIVLKWNFDDIRNDRLGLLNGVKDLPDRYKEFSKTALESYYDSFKPYVLEDARATIAAGLEAKRNKSAVKYNFRLDRDVKQSRSVNNPCKLEVDLDILEEVEGKSRVAVILSPTKIKGIKILGLASQHGFGNRDKKTIIKFIASEDTRITCNSVLVKGAQWSVSILGSVLSHERIYEACCLKPEVAFLPQIVCGKIPQIPAINKSNHTGLNDSQFKAVEGFISADDGLYMLQGPPGTGKTSTIVELIYSVAKHKKRILICAPSNKAVQVIADRFFQKFHDEKIAIILAGVESKLPDSLIPIFLHTWSQSLLRLVNELKSLITRPEGYLAQGKKTVGLQANTTLNEKYRQYLDKKSTLISLLDKYKITQFSWELNNATKQAEHYFQCLQQESDYFWQSVLETTGKEPKEPDSRHRQYNQNQDYAVQSWVALIAVIKKSKDLEEKLLENADVLFSTLSVTGRKQMRQTKKVDILIVDEAGQSIEAETLIPFILQPRKCLLVGDTKQLPATVISQAAEKMGYGRSMMYRLLEDCSQPFHMLDTQYRMHPMIRYWPSIQFYQNRIMDGPNIVRRLSPFSTLNSKIHQPYSFIQTNGQESAEGTSFCNQAESNLIAKYISFLSARHKIDPKTQIGIISFYSGQVRLLQQQIPKQFKPRINTVDGFQGDENDIIIISFVRSNSRNTVGFLHDFRRLNVAITRGKHAVIMFGDVNTLKADRNLKSLLQHLESQKLIFTQDDFENSLLPEPKQEKPVKQPTSKAEEKKSGKEKSLPSNYKTVLCKNFKSGSCKKGDKCTYAHGKDELVKPQKTKTATAVKSTEKNTPAVATVAKSGSIQGQKDPKINSKESKSRDEQSVKKSSQPSPSQERTVDPVRPKRASTHFESTVKQFNSTPLVQAPTSTVKAANAPKPTLSKNNTVTVEVAQDILPPIVTTISNQTAKQPATKPVQDPYSMLEKYRKKSSVSTPSKQPSTNKIISSEIPAVSAPVRAVLAQTASISTTQALPPITRLASSKNNNSATVPVSQDNSVIPIIKQSDNKQIPKLAPGPYSILEKYRPSSSGGAPPKQAEQPSINKITSSEIQPVPAPARATLPQPVSLSRPAIQKKAVMICRFFANGKCPNGEKCEMRHDQTSSQLSK